MRCDANPAELEIPAFQKLWNELERAVNAQDEPDSDTEKFYDALLEV